MARAPATARPRELPGRDRQWKRGRGAPRSAAISPVDVPRPSGHVRRPVSAGGADVGRRRIRWIPDASGAQLQAFGPKTAAREMGRTEFARGADPALPLDSDFGIHHNVRESRA